MDVEESGWSRTTHNRPRTTPSSWRRREYKDSGRDKTTDRRSGQEKPRTISRLEDRKCHRCGKDGHLVAQCPRTRYFECGNEGHIARQCPYVYHRKRSGQAEPMEVAFQYKHVNVT
ncbi:uncharacterized protein [Halyomorpha halys]|uniref:uncharacterized protein n=1 Tax=Halyomorpha halys TaxID=286706 RepID=UPI0034D37A5E